MQTGMLSLPARRWGRLVLVALLGLTIALVTVSASHASAGHAVAAKKFKCKKKKHRSATSSKKKKKCKKVKHVVLPAPGPVARGILAWTANDEVDLHAFDASGNHAGWDYNVNPPFGALVNNIPNGRHLGDVGAGGPAETFSDDIFVRGGPSNREFAYVACLYDDGDVPYTATFTGATRTGFLSSVSLDGPGVYTLTTPGGPAVPNPGSVC
jgi:hypothetical protein